MGIIFGPVKSRRLGLSLGLELVPKKICSMDCLYCEVGKTTKLTLEREAYISWEQIEKGLLEAKGKEKEYDVLTLTGSGEPTLNLHFEKTVFTAKNVVSKPISVLTNSTTLNLSSVREALAQVDLVLASLDCALEKSFKLLNRPARGVQLKEIIEGLKILRDFMKGELWLEVLLVRNVNDSDEDLKALKEAINYINPHKVQLNTVVRPPAYPMAKALSFKELERIREFLGERAEVIVSSEPKVKTKKLSKEELERLIIEYLRRRPAPFPELSFIFSFEKDHNIILEELIQKGQIKKIFHEGEFFYLIKGEILSEF
ncbi:MAG: radical SAM protein [Thermodesulfobacteriaceae bacterium]|nr:radical SAM protein [Thermodesulfobacteriaceae bacterium]